MYYRRRLVKILFLIINFLIILVGALGVALGIYLRMDNSISGLKFFQSAPSDEATCSECSNWPDADVLSIVLIITGAMLIITGFCGCCCASMKILWLLRTYGAVLLVEAVLLVAAAILAIVFWNSVQLLVEGRVVRALNESFIVDPLCSNSSMIPNNSTASSTGCKEKILSFISRVLFIGIASVGGAVLFLAHFLSILLLYTIRSEMASRMIVAYSYDVTSESVSRIK